jgi:hypothetical protein
MEVWRTTGCGHFLRGPSGTTGSFSTRTRTNIMRQREQRSHLTKGLSLAFPSSSESVSSSVVSQRKQRSHLTKTGLSLASPSSSESVSSSVVSSSSLSGPDFSSSFFSTSSCRGKRKQSVYCPMRKEVVET